VNHADARIFAAVCTDIISRMQLTTRARLCSLTGEHTPHVPYHDAALTPRYANAAIGPASTIIKKYIYPEAFKGTQNASLISSMAFAGIIIGQLSFGWISDKIGRKVRFHG